MSITVLTPGASQSFFRQLIEVMFRERPRTRKYVDVRRLPLHLQKDIGLLD